MADRTLHKKRTIHGVQLESMSDGVWHIVGVPMVTGMFIHHGSMQAGASSRRYKMQVWTAPLFPVEHVFKTLKEAVKAWKDKYDAQRIKDVEQAV